MARPQEFNTEEVLTKAMNVFWKQGYKNTSINDLESYTEISRISLYNAFKSKEGVFLAALDLYLKNIQKEMALQFKERSLSELEQFFRTITSSENTSFTALFGCLMVNTILDIPEASDDIKQRIIKYRSIFKHISIEILQEAAHRLKNHTDIEEKAELLTATLWGIMVTNRLYAGTNHSQLMANQIIKTIHSWVV
jgi:TetR/AcrR family transcriptional repressor of nem operon